MNGFFVKLGRNNRGGLSLLEMLISLVILIVLAALLMPIITQTMLNVQAHKSVRNVRNLQLANIQYAADMDGWYVPFNVVSNGDIYSGQWMRNDIFQKNLGITSNPHGKTYYPSGYLSPRSTIGRYPDGYGPIERNYAYNDDIFLAHKMVKPIYQIRNSEVVHPSALLAFADSLDFWISIDYADNYRGTEEYVQGGVAYRYGGRAAVAFFDGHAALLSREEVVGNKSLWQNK